MSFSSSRSILCLTVLWFAGGISSWAEEAPPAWSLSAADRQAVVAVVDRAIVAGMPDAKGGKLYQGALKLITADDQKAVGEGKISNVGNQTFNGLHLKLADGTWVVSLSWSMAGAQGITVDDKGLSELAVDQVLIKAQQTAFRADDQFAVRLHIDQQRSIPGRANSTGPPDFFAGQLIQRDQRATLNARVDEQQFFKQEQVVEIALPLVKVLIKEMYVCR